MRLRRRQQLVIHDLGSEPGRLSEDLVIELVYGLGIDGFTIPRGVYEKSYWAYKDILMGRCRPFQRPSAFWCCEVGGGLGVGPDCVANGNESERSALVRLGLPLTQIELAKLSPAEVEQWNHAKRLER